MTRTGSFTDPRYDRFEITPTMLMVRNFEAGVCGQGVFVGVRWAGCSLARSQLDKKKAPPAVANEA